jgi:hypothetical protein
MSEMGQQCRIRRPLAMSPVHPIAAELLHYGKRRGGPNLDI